MSHVLRNRRLAVLATSLLAAFVLALSTAGAASAFSESYGFYEVGNSGYVQSAGAHTFIYNDGAASVGGTLACQLFNSKGVNEVEHGGGACTVLYGGGAFVWARVYDEAGFPQVIGGEAGTSGLAAEHSAGADGLNPADAKYVFTLADGASVAIVGNDLSKCLIRTIGTRTADMCASTAAIAEGQGVSVGDECGTSGRNVMEIVGLALSGAVSARLRSSDGTSQTTSVIDGAFAFDGTNPAQGAPYPIGVEWVAGDGATIATAALPIEDDNFCLPT
jgi:hypothetical protein